MKLAEFFTKGAKQPTTAVAARAAIADAEKASQAAAARYGELAEQRADALLVADDEALDRIDQQLGRASRDVDRADAALMALRRQLAEIEAKDQVAHFNEVYSAGLEAQRQALALIGRYGDLAEKIADILDELDEHDQAIKQANAELLAAGDPRQIVDPDALARPQGEVQTLRIRLSEEVRLPSATGLIQKIYPRLDCWGGPIKRARAA